LTFAPDLKQNLDSADAVSESIKNTIDAHIAERGLDAPHEARYVPVWEPDGDVRELDIRAAAIGSVIWSTGYQSDFRWIDVPAFDGKGYPTHRRGVSSVSGLYFLGLPWLYTWGSGRFSGIARDAEYVADHLERAGRTGLPDHHAAADDAREYVGRLAT
jgi:putative flavoprotein involved in K+ transport